MEKPLFLLLVSRGKGLEKRGGARGEGLYGKGVSFLFRLFFFLLLFPSILFSSAVKQTVASFSLRRLPTLG